MARAGSNAKCSDCSIVPDFPSHRHKSPSPVGAIDWSSLRVGKWVARGRAGLAGSPPAGLAPAEPKA